MRGEPMSRAEIDTGTANAERVLLIPGLDGAPELVMSAAPKLFPGRRVLPFDHRREGCDGGIDGLAERALARLDADPDGQAPAYICGESFGGTVALTLARRYPERVRGLVLLSTFGWYPAWSSRGARFGMGVWRVVGDSVAERVFRAWRPVSVFGALGRHPDRELWTTFVRWPDMDLPGYRAKCQIALTFDARPWLGKLACPTFILIGTRDPVVPIGAGRELARRIPNARLHQLPGGHLVHVVRAEEAGALIAAWTTDIATADEAPATTRPMRT